MSSYKTKIVNSIPELTGGHIFNTPAFISLKGVPFRCYLLERSGELVARIVFTLLNREAISGYRATFGSFDIFDDVPQEALIHLIDEVCLDLSKSNLRRITISQPALIYPKTEYIDESLRKTGFMITASETNQHITVSGEDFGRRIKKSELSKLKIASSAKFKVKIVSRAELPAIYELIVDTHTRRGYPVSLSFEELDAVIKVFPQQYILFCLYDNDELIAAAISIRVTDKVLYNFYHADHYSYRSKSPLVMLIGEIYKYCQNNKIEIIDLGISTVGGELNEGLFNFKKRLGCEVSIKNTFTLEHE